MTPGRRECGDLGDDVVVDGQEPERAPVDAEPLFPEVTFDARSFEISRALPETEKDGLATCVDGVEGAVTLSKMTPSLMPLN